jgi:hypothetical protein
MTYDYNGGLLYSHDCDWSYEEAEAMCNAQRKGSFIGFCAGCSWGVSGGFGGDLTNPIILPKSSQTGISIVFSPGQFAIGSQFDGKKPEKSEYSFEGWALDARGKVKFDTEMKINTHEQFQNLPKVLYASWRAYPKKFVDLAKIGAERKADIDWLTENEISVGTGCVNGGGKKCKYSPSSAVNRGAMAEFMWKLMGRPEITKPVPKIVDIEGFKKSTPDRYTAIRWLASEWVTIIGSDGKYNPKKSVNRGAMAEFMYKLAGSPGVLTFGSMKDSHPSPAALTSMAKKFKSDKTLVKLAKTNPNRYYDILWMASVGVTTGSDKKGTKYSPNQVVNRGAMAQFLHRLYKNTSTGDI